ncbi:uncharacterized protein LOC126980053 [Leptidea sinapis]|uniref:uncharacterized protein LOC126980053 n=1 Tax=Leptidea sinapis TaxID=189913 RepID=UPI0021434CB0|nr:uncharacterized protein LOC126980053 [Leptidea sinapis]
MISKVIYFAVLVGVVTSKEDFGLKYMTKVYEDCRKSEGILPCLTSKAITFFDRAAKMDAISLIDGVDIVKTGHEISENEVDSTIPRNLENSKGLTDVLFDRIAAFVNSRTIQLSLPKISGQELNKGVEEGRGKMKKMMGMMMMGAAMKMAAMIPLAIAGLFVLAGKALIISKIALLLAGIIALKKLIAAKNSSGGHESQGWSSGGSGGWDRRSLDASDLVYSAYKRVGN